MPTFTLPEIQTQPPPVLTTTEAPEKKKTTEAPEKKKKKTTTPRPPPPPPTTVKPIENINLYGNENEIPFVPAQPQPDQSQYEQPTADYRQASYDDEFIGSAYAQPPSHSYATPGLCPQNLLISCAPVVEQVPCLQQQYAPPPAPEYVPPQVYRPYREVSYDYYSYPEYHSEYERSADIETTVSPLITTTSLSTTAASSSSTSSSVEQTTTETKSRTDVVTPSVATPKPLTQMPFQHEHPVTSELNLPKVEEMRPIVNDIRENHLTHNFHDFMTPTIQDTRIHELSLTHGRNPWNMENPINSWYDQQRPMMDEYTRAMQPDPYQYHSYYHNYQPDNNYMLQMSHVYQMPAMNSDGGSPTHSYYDYSSNDGSTN